jgi:hypothetical protein
MFTIKDFIAFIIIGLSSFLIANLVNCSQSEDFDVNNEITMIDRNSYKNKNSEISKPYNLKPAVYSQNSYRPATNSCCKTGVKRNSIILLIRKNVSNCGRHNRVSSINSLVIYSILNKNQVSIKITKEMETDLNKIYQVTEIMLISNGGLPLSAFSNPDLEQFFDGTYFPPLYSNKPLKRKALNGFITQVSDQSGNEK